MSAEKKNNLGFIIGLVVALGVGVLLGSQFDFFNNKEIAKLTGTKNIISGNFESKTTEELAAALSGVMLPDDEYEKLIDAINQTAMGLLMAQAQSESIEVKEPHQADLKKSIEGKYSKEYFTNLNSKSMEMFSKSDLAGILTFYYTSAGQKFLQKSPEIISNTMQEVQADLSQWLPQTVDALITKISGKKTGENKANTDEQAKAKG